MHANTLSSIPIEANSPARKSWLEVDENSDFPIQNLPLGIFSTQANPQKRVGMALGRYIIDLHALRAQGHLDVDDLRLEEGVFQAPYLNALLGHGRPLLRRLRNRVSALLSTDNDTLSSQGTHHGCIVKQSDASLHLPVKISNYTDFYSSLEHASNVGSLFRDPKNPLLPNWKHLPVGYHGRVSSIIPSGTDIVRPMGQRKPLDAKVPLFSASTQLDFEVEMAFITCTDTPLGQRIPIAESEAHIAGFLLLNDWSARDIQAWEYVPLGPFLGKNFASSISYWLVSIDALDSFRLQGPPQDVPLLPYLQHQGRTHFDVHLTAELITPQNEPLLLCHTNFKHMYWSIHQQLAHHTVNGCNICVGDMYASGTISGKTPSSYGSLLELTHRGQNPLTLSDGSKRTFIEDYDAIKIAGYAQGKGDIRIGFGEVSGRILPAEKYNA